MRKLLIVLAPVSIPRVSEVAIDGPVLAATLGLALFMPAVTAYVLRRMGAHANVTSPPMPSKLEDR